MTSLEERWAEARPTLADGTETTPAWVLLGAAHERLDRAENLLARAQQEIKSPAQANWALLDEINSFLEEID